MSRKLPLATLAVALVAAALPATAQPVSVPRQGDNQKASVTQHVGLVAISVDYSSPDVHAPDGTDRRGKIWGQLVPYGWHAESFGTCGEKCPWRGGADENTVLTVSHDVLVEGQPLTAGAYGLHFVPGESEWQVIFSRNSTAWGSFFYDENEDALRVTVRPEKAPYREWLSYDFVDRQPDRATLALEWEELRVPISIVVPDPAELYYAKLREELQSWPGFDAGGWQRAADYLIAQKVHLDDAERWAQHAVAQPFFGEENWSTLRTLAAAQRANGKAAEADATMAKALAHPTTTPIDLYFYARPMIREGRAAEALAVFQDAAQRFPGAWPTDVGLARAYSALGDVPKALEHARAALAIAPDEANRENLERMVERLGRGEDINR